MPPEASLSGPHCDYSSQWASPECSTGKVEPSGDDEYALNANSPTKGEAFAPGGAKGSRQIPAASG